MEYYMFNGLKNNGPGKQKKKINKKLNFIMTLKAYMEGKNEEQIIKSNINK